jgi:RNA recognition motif-containing protein
MDCETGRQRGFAFSETSSDQEAQQAIQQLNGRALDGRAINVNEAQERVGGGGSGGGGGAALGIRAMMRGYSGGKRNREANRDLRKKQKEHRLRRNRDLRVRGVAPVLTDTAGAAAPLPEVEPEDVIIGVVYVTKPKPHDWLLARSLITATSTSSPNRAKASPRSALVVSELKPPTNNFTRPKPSRGRDGHQGDERRRARRADDQGQPRRGVALPSVGCGFRYDSLTRMVGHP